MSTPNDGGPVFARTACEWNSPQDGMSLRDYFAAKAMQGILAGAITDGGACTNIHHTGAGMHLEAIKKVADISYLMADAMIERRQRQ